MERDSLDTAIDLVANNVEDLTNSAISEIVQGGDGFTAACNRLSVRTAARLVAGEIGFDAADSVMNWVWSYITTEISAGAPLPELAYSIYDAIDAGEYRHSGNGSDVDPVQTYTIPALREILAELEF